MQDILNYSKLWQSFYEYNNLLKIVFFVNDCLLFLVIFAIFLLLLLLIRFGNPVLFFGEVVDLGL